MKLYSFKEISSFKENIFIQGKYMNLTEYIHLRNIYSFKFKVICSFKEAIFIQQRCVRGHSRNNYSKIVPSHFIIIISFTVTISWIKYGYNSRSFRHEEWKNCWYNRGFRIIITVRAAFATIVPRRRNTTRIAARFRHYIFAKIWDARQRAIYI